MSPIVEISPDGLPTGQPMPSSDVDRALAAGKAKANNTAVIDLPKADDTPPVVVDEPVKVEPAAKVESKVEPTKADEPKADDTSINDFLELAGKELVKDEKPKEVQTQQQTIKKDSTVDPDKQSLQTIPNADKTLERDYSDIDPEHQEAFKRMHNDPYNLLKPIYKEHKVLKVENEKLKEIEKQYKELKEKGPQLPDSYYENPNGFLLNPDFQVAVQQQNVAQTILNHWTKQYQEVAGGAKEIDFLDFDNQGNLVITGKRPADKAVEAQLIQYVSHAQNQLTNATATVRAIAATHKDKASQVIKSFNDNTAQEYSTFDKPENKPIYEPLIKKELEALHPMFRNSPLAISYAKSRVMVAALARLLQQAADERNKNATNTNGNGNTNGNPTNQNRNKQPTAAQINGGGTDRSKVANGEDVTMDDFKNAKGVE